MTWILQVQHWMEALILTAYFKILYLLEQELLFIQMMISPLQLLSSNWKGSATECQCKIAKIEKKIEKKNLFPVQENASFSLSVSFLKSECRISMCQLGTKALEGMAQNNISQGCKLASQRSSILQTQTLYQGFVLRFFLRLFQSMPLSWKNPTG